MKSMLQWRTEEMSGCIDEGASACKPIVTVASLVSVNIKMVGRANLATIKRRRG